ncbi:MAG: endolytic transglycosylase MltG [Brevefilum sp.]|jgi:UPF0755 protein
MTRNKKKRNISTLFFVFFIIACVAIVAGYFGVNLLVKNQFGHPDSSLSNVQRIIFPLELFLYRDKLTTAQNLGEEEKIFEIGQGESVSMVCYRLEQHGLIDDAELMRIYLIYTGLDRQLKSGKFRLNSALSPVEITTRLIDPGSEEAIVSILPGWRIEEIAANIEASGLAISADDFIRFAYAPNSIVQELLPVPDVRSLEGFLFPGTYVFPRDADLDTLVWEILSTFNENIDQTLVDGYARQGLTMYEALSLASIVEKEAVVDEEKPLIASVFYNRLAIGMRLETDPTVQYAIGLDAGSHSWWKSPLSLQDLTVESPYNTYIITGLPPTPICNPGLESLRAVAFPAETPYYYFRAACDDSGRHLFAITFEEHLNNHCE